MQWWSFVLSSGYGRHTDGQADARPGDDHRRSGGVFETLDIHALQAVRRGQSAGTKGWPALEVSQGTD